MYLIVNEDGEVYKAEEITQGDKEAADNGILVIINTDTMMQYNNDDWVELLEWEKFQVGFEE